MALLRKTFSLKFLVGNSSLSDIAMQSAKPFRFMTAWHATNPICNTMFGASRLFSNKSTVHGQQQSKEPLPVDNVSRKMQIRQRAPDFAADAVVKGTFTKIRLDDYRGKYVVLFFYPLDFTFVCPTEIIAFSDNVEKFREINCEVLACSVDSAHTHLAWTNTPRNKGGLGSINIPLLADITKKMSSDYGVLLNGEGIALRGLFIIDGTGTLRQITMNDLPVGRSVEETLRLVKAFQYTDKHGEVCPANWEPGSKTIVPHPEKSKEYFANVK